MIPNPLALVVSFVAGMLLAVILGIHHWPKIGASLSSANICGVTLIFTGLALGSAFVGLLFVCVEIITGK